MRVGLIGAVLLSGALLAAGCSSGGGAGASPSSAASSSAASSSSAAPSASSAASVTVCPEVAALRASPTELSHLSFGPNALNKLKTDVGNVKTNLVALHDTAGTEWQGQLSALQTALSKLQKTLSSLGRQPNATAAAKAVSTDLAGVTASVRCPDPTPTPSG